MHLVYRYLFPALLVVSSTAALARSSPAPENNNYAISQPWFTGPLLAPAGVTIPKGHTNIEPYFFYTDSFGVYSSNWQVVRTPSSKTISPTMIISQGLADRLDAQASIPYNYNYNSTDSYHSFGDVSFLLGFQAIASDTWPNLRITVGETFPTGHYNNLSSIHSGVEATGAGSYQTGFAANFQKVFRVFSGRVLRTRLSLAYTIPSSVHVTGFNSYGGGFGTNGTVNPANRFSVDAGLEYTLTQHWVPALDVVFAHASSGTFRGIPGVTATGGVPSNAGMTYDVISLAPAIEYNFTSRIGVIAGAWFSVTGKNTSNFASGVVALNCYI